MRILPLYSIDTLKILLMALAELYTAVVPAIVPCNFKLVVQCCFPRRNCGVLAHPYLPPPQKVL